GKGFPAAVGPDDLDGVEAGDAAQAEVDRGGVAAQVTLPGADHADATAVRHHRHLRTVGVAPAVPRSQAGADAQEVTAVRGDVAVEPGPARDGGYQQVEGAVAVDVAGGQAARHAGRPAQDPVGPGDVPEPSLAVAGEQLVALGVPGPERAQLGLVAGAA